MFVSEQKQVLQRLDKLTQEARKHIIENSSSHHRAMTLLHTLELFCKGRLRSAVPFVLESDRDGSARSVFQRAVRECGLEIVEKHFLLSLSARSRTLLKQHGGDLGSLASLRILVQHSQAELLKYRGFGRAACIEVECALAGLGLWLKMSEKEVNEAFPSFDN